MQYFVKRGEEKFGPYTLAELQRYVQSGNIAPTDLAQSEGMTDWAAVAQILGNIPAAVTTYSSSEIQPAAQLVPLPPNLHWSIVLILGIVTREIFNLILALVIANWAR